MSITTIPLDCPELIRLPPDYPTPLVGEVWRDREGRPVYVVLEVRHPGHCLVKRLWSYAQEAPQEET